MKAATSLLFASLLLPAALLPACAHNQGVKAEEVQALRSELAELKAAQDKTSAELAEVRETLTRMETMAKQAVEDMAAQIPKPEAESTTTLELAAGDVIKSDDTHFELKRAVLDRVLASPMSAARAVRLVPSIHAGRTNGFKLFSIRPGSLFAELGFRNGDTIHSVNGMDLNSPDKALEAYSALRTAKSLELALTRQGKAMTLTIDIVK